MVYTVSGVNYTRRKKIPVTGAGSGAQTNYQIKLAAIWAAAMQADFDDVRFTKADMQTLIDAWLESKVDSTSADIWAEFPTTPADGVEEIEAYMYFGNAGAANYWDIGATFVFGDDFGDADYTDKWQTGGGSGTITESSGTLKITSSNYCAVKLLNALSSDSYHVRTRSKVNSISSSNVAYVAIKNNTNNMSPFLQGFGGYMCYVRSGLRSLWRIDQSGNASLDSDSAAIDTGWHTREVYTTGATPHALYDAADFSASDSTYTSFVDILIGQSSSASQTSEFDWVTVNKYVSAPPTAAFGTEEHQRRTPMMM